MSDQLHRSERARSCDIPWLNVTESIALGYDRNGLVRMCRVTVPGQKLRPTKSLSSAGVFTCSRSRILNRIKIHGFPVFDSLEQPGIWKNEDKTNSCCRSAKAFVLICRTRYPD
jgi:hypothetical protein